MTKLYNLIGLLHYKITDSFTIANYKMVIICFGLLVTVAAAAPVFFLLLHGPSIFCTNPEFISYRVCDALSIIFGYSDHVRPVQGLATALLSKWIVWVLHNIYKHEILSTRVLQLYSIIFFIIFFAIIYACVSKAWFKINWLQRIALSTFIIVPWYTTPTNMTLPVPEYWLGEYIFLLCSMAIIYVSQNQKIFLSPILIGALAGIGISIKITLIGITPLFFLTIKHKDLRNASLSIISAALTYYLIVFIYSGLSFGTTLKILSRQIAFYIHPNQSYTYNDWFICYKKNISYVFFLLSSIFLTTITMKKKILFQNIAIGLWIGLYIFLVGSRLHESSIASAILGLLFIICYLGPQIKNKLLLSVLTISTSIIILNGDGSPYIPYYMYNKAPVENFEFNPKGILFMPNNHWNSGVLIQAIGYNGGIGLYPTHIDPVDNVIKYADRGGDLFQKFFDGVVIMNADDESFKKIQLSLLNGVKLHWVRPSTQSNFEATTQIYEKLKTMLYETKATLTEKIVTYRGVQWYVGSACIL